ncbi:19574_t:CDS:2 [Funneliformis geosporum]|uniref:8768_t:CDS:1 n=1 Tax=Funneliformis geosporum TaxID=1117311 RepID=A0A9W4SF78_9GLOM|nr:8768_t:CDS:2 [Funneliformis geosporum]CAI2174410.1 19574_t:CDS:2 [Funneliformis geosporum]
MIESIAEIAEYAQLAQQCYNIPNEDTHKLPKNWEVIFAPENQGSWDTFYALYVNPVKMEVVLGIRGTDKLFNILADTGLFVAALTNKPVIVPDTPQVEYLAKYIHHYNLNSSAEELHQLGQSIRKFDQEVGSSMKNWVLALLYIAAISTGLYASSALADASIVLKIIASGTIIGLGTSALMKLKEETHRKLIERLSSEKCLKIGVECITFESPGALEILDQLAQYRNKPRDIINYLCAPNIINTLNHHPGITYRIKLPHTDGSLSLLHGANCVLQTASIALSFGSLGIFSIGKGLIIKGSAEIAKVAGLSAVGTVVAGGIAGIWCNINWVKRQHNIDNIVTYLQSNDPQLVKIDSWPHVYWKDFANQCWEFARDFVPLQKDKPGIRNFIDEEGMREAQIKRIPGYREILA